jgi:hypothetical protein
LPNNDLTYGRSATLTASGAQANSTFVWRFWDAVVQTTKNSAIRWPINRPQLDISVEIFDQSGQSVTKQSSALTANTPPQLLTTRLSIVQQILPYYATLSVSGIDDENTPVFTWTDSNGNVIAESNPSVNFNSFSFTYLVTRPDTELTLTISENTEITSFVTFDFTFPGYYNQPPVASTFSSNLEPVAWVALISPVTAATQVGLLNLAGQPAVDSIQIPPAWAWTGSNYTFNNPARVLVRSQVDSTQNGVYLATTSQLNYTLDSNAYYTAGNVSYSGNTLLISNSTTEGHNSTPVISDHVQVGRQILLSSDAGDWVVLAVSAVQPTSSGITATVSVVNSLGNLNFNSAATLDFSWIRSNDVLALGTTVYVNQGTLHGGDYFALVTDPQPDTITLGATQIFFYKASCDYTGGNQPKGRVYFEETTSDQDLLQCSADLNLISLNYIQNTDPTSANVIRAKAVTDGVATGTYEVSEQISDYLQISGFVTQSSLVKAQFTVT